MISKTYTFICVTVIFLAITCSSVYAGNPDRQGEAGAYELLMNPWARSAGLHTMPISMVRGVESMRLNVAGLSRVNKLEAQVGHAIYLQGAQINMNAFGIATKMGENGALGVTIMSLDMGDIRETTVNQPEGTGATYSPNYFNIGLGYAYTFENKISVGFGVRMISETTKDLSAFGFALDAGVQYVSGEYDNFKFGISLRNIGSPMKFSGEGLANQVNIPSGNYELTVDQRSANFELPSMLNIGLSYDFLIGMPEDDSGAWTNRLTILGAFISNSFSRDQVGGGVEYAMKEMFMLRAGYRYDIGSSIEAEAPIYTGLSAGATVEVPISKRNKDLKLGFDYAYRATKVWSGTHNFSVRINF